MMGVYEYTAKDTAGNELTGVYTNVDNVQVLREELGKLGYVLVHVRRGSNTWGARIRPKDIGAFVYKFASMYSAGLPLVRCLETLGEQADNRALKSVIVDVQQRVETGSSLKSAFEPHRRLFGDFFLGMVQAGEASGELAKALDMSSTYLEKRLELRQKTRAAFVYPMVVSAVCCLVVTCLLIFVVPMFSKLYTRMHVTLPGPTQALVTLSYILRHGWWILPVLAVGALLATRYLGIGPHIRAAWDRVKLRMPLLGPLNRLIAVSQFIRTFGILISVGIPVMDALEAAGAVAHNSEMSRITAELEKATRAGQPLSQSLADHPIFPPMVVQMVTSGEEVGILPTMLAKSADVLDKDIDRMTAALLMKLEPALTIIMGLIIGLILMGVYLPMFDYMAKMTK